MIKQPEILLFGLSTCGWCEKVHLFLKKHNFEHSIAMVDTLPDPEKEAARADLKKYNARMSYPTLVIDKKIVITGFDSEKMKKALGLSEQPSPEELMLQLKSEAEAAGYNLNPEKKMVMALMKGLLKNDSRYGYMACPCMESYGSKKLDTDIICPCDYRDDDLADYGACFCALYVSDDVVKGKQKAVSIPLRRPLKEKLEKQIAEQNKPDSESASGFLAPSSTPQVSEHVWRCKVCGYLCAKENPPHKCPVCSVGKERFELFMKKSEGA